MSDQDEMKEFLGSNNGNEDYDHPVAISECRVSSTELPLATKDDKMWAVHANTFFPCDHSVDTLPVGQYTIEFSDTRGVFFKKKDVTLDDLILLPDSASEEIQKQIETFWTKEKHFRDFGFLWKRGIMLWGPPGSGKTSVLQQVSQNIINNGGLSIYVTNPAIAAVGLELLRRIEPTRPVIVMLEDIDAIIRNQGEAELLALLDGELQIDNVVFIATTNYPERLDKRFKNRPSRFDLVKKIGMPNSEARRVFLTKKNTKLTRSEITNWVKSTEGFSIAHLKELIVSVEVFEVKFDDAVARLRTMMDKEISSDDDSNKRPAGFY